MSIETDLCAYLKGLTALGINGQVFPMFAEENATPPFIIYRRISPTLRTQTLSAGPVKLPTAHFRVTCWAMSYAEAVAQADALRAAVGAVRRGTPIACVQQMAVVDEADDFEPSPELLQKQFFGRYLILRVVYNE